MIQIAEWMIALWLMLIYFALVSIYHALDRLVKVIQDKKGKADE